jgi:hypothetical protein
MSFLRGAYNHGNTEGTRYISSRGLRITMAIHFTRPQVSHPGRGGLDSQLACFGQDCFDELSGDRLDVR